MQQGTVALLLLAGSAPATAFALRAARASVVVASAARAEAKPPAKSDFMLQKLPAGRGSFLLHTWGQAAQTVRANGFSPASEAVGDGAFRMKALSEALPKVVAQAKIVGVLENGSVDTSSLEEPHKSNGERLARTKLMAAISSGKGSAAALVSEWDDHVSIDACVVNPSYMGLSEGAEAILLRHVAEEAIESGKEYVRLVSMYQVAGDEFYAACGFYPSEEEAEEGVLRFKPASTASSPSLADAEPEEEQEEEMKDAAGGDVEGPPPAGFVWGGEY